MQTVTFALSSVLYAVALIFGVLMCFFGFKTFRISMAAAGGYIGKFLGDMLYKAISDGFPETIKEPVHVIICLVAMVGMGVLAYIAYKKAVFAVAAVSVTGLVYSVYTTLNPDLSVKTRLIVLLISLACGVVSGFAVTFMQKWAIIIFTSIIGAKLIAFTVSSLVLKITGISYFATTLTDTLFKNHLLSSSASITGILVIALSVAGFVVQAGQKSSS